MVAVEGTRSRGDNFVVVRHKQSYMYARWNDKCQRYDVMAVCGEHEAEKIVEAANKGSNFGG